MQRPNIIVVCGQVVNEVRGSISSSKLTSVVDLFHVPLKILMWGCVVFGCVNILPNPACVSKISVECLS